jgi:hypothetical protein
VPPERLPSEKDELLDLVRTLWSGLKIQIVELHNSNMKARGKTPRALDERQLHSYCWALIVLQHDPPAGHAKAVQDFLAELLKHEAEESAEEIVKVVSKSEPGEVAGSQANVTTAPSWFHAAASCRDPRQVPSPTKINQRQYSCLQ